MRSHRIGLTNLLISVTCFLVFSFNIIDLVKSRDGILRIILYAIPFLVLSVLFLIVKNNVFNYVVFLLIAAFTTMFSEIISDFSGSILFIFAYAQLKNGRTAVIVTVVTLISIFTRTLLNNDVIGGVLMVVVYAYVYGLYYLIIEVENRNENNRLEIVKSIKDQNEQLIKLMAIGYSQKEAAAEMGITQNQASNIIKRMKRDTGYSTLTQIMYQYGAIYGNQK